MSIEKKRAELEAADLTFVMSTPEGRRNTWRVLSKCGQFRQSYIPDSDATTFNEGQRSIGLWLYADLETHCPEQYLLMQREAVQRAQIERREIEDERTRRANSAE